MLGCILETGMLVWGIVILATGQMKLGANKVVTGLRARVIGMMFLMPLPVVITVESLFEHFVGTSESSIVFALLRLGIGLGILALGMTMCVLMGKPPITNGQCASCGYSTIGNLLGICADCGSRVTVLPAVPGLIWDSVYDVPPLPPVAPPASVANTTQAAPPPSDPENTNDRTDDP